MLNTDLKSRIIKIWYSTAKPWIFLFVPFSWIYQVIIFLRRWMYRFRLFKTTRFSVPVIVVGNITVGGTGKTPLVITLVNLLKAKGWNPGVVSRGYGGKISTSLQVVTENSDPTQVGDEPLLITLKTGCPVVVSPKRVKSAEILLKQFHCNIIISDDGLQHYALGRDIEIAVVDGERKMGNGFCLPAGPLREPVSRLKQVNWVVVNGETVQFIPKNLYRLHHREMIEDIQNWQGRTVHAVAGIGNPDRFFNQLRTLGLNVIEHPFPDHYYYHASDLYFNDHHPIIITEKDAVKCRDFLCDNVWCLSIEAKLSEQFVDEFCEKIL